MKPVRFHPDAELELAAAIEYYEVQRAGLGINLRREMEAAAGLIAQNPEMFPTRGPDGVRR